jgi:hypothetical protein
VLLTSEGLTAEAIASAVGKSLLTVRRWRRGQKAIDDIRICGRRPAGPSRTIAPDSMTHHQRSPRSNAKFIDRGNITQKRRSG